MVTFRPIMLYRGMQQALRSSGLLVCLSGQFTQSDDFKVKHFGIMWMSSNLFKKECMEMHTVKNNAISWWWLTNTCSKIPKNEEGSLCSNEITLSYMVVVVFLV